jgi:hypothetical protein
MPVTGKGGGICRTCAGQDPRAAETAFRKRLAELGATPAYEKWVNARTPYKVICKNGHECWPRPDGLQKRKGPCSICARNNSAAAEREFRERLAKLGAVPVYATWEGAGKPHKVICPEGHECAPLPSATSDDHVPCKTCSKVDPVASEVAFRKRLDELGVIIEWTGWRGARAKYRAICAEGHECWPRPDGLLRGGACRACAGRDPVEAEAKARRRLQALGFTPAWGQWVGPGQPHKVVCPAGHEFLMYPSGLPKRGCTCPHCAGTTTEAIEAAFREAVIKQGATPAWDAWLGAVKGHKVICGNGHECYPTPNSIQQGKGVCRFCKGKDWDVFYILVNDERREIKFGITSGNPRGRLAVHRNRGFSRVVLVTASPLALKVETETKMALRAAGVRAIRGREYFPLAALDEVVQVAMSYGLEAEIRPGGWPMPPGMATA